MPIKMIGQSGEAAQRTKSTKIRDCNVEEIQIVFDEPLAIRHNQNASFGLHDSSQ